MRNFVISLVSATDRRHHIEKEFSKHHVKFDFFDALTPSTTPNYIESNNLSIDLASNQLTSLESACMMSHIAIWRQIIEDKIPYATIFEDDIYLGDNADYFLSQTEWISPELDIIKIETVNKKVILDKKNKYTIPHDRQLIALKSKHVGAGAYTLSLKGAKSLLAYVLNHSALPIDELIFKNFIVEKITPVYQMTPALCIQDIIRQELGHNLILPSSLEVTRRKRMRSTKISKVDKVYREVGRVLEQTKYSIFSQVVPFK